MVSRRVALIGHSGAGKSACLVALQVDCDSADMDAVLGTKHCTSLPAALEWLTSDSTPELVVVSNHEQMLLAMRGAKLGGQFADQFARVLLVYLHKPKNQLGNHLAMPNAGGLRRKPDSVLYTLDHYDRFKALFRDLADRSVDCSGRAVADVAAEVQAIVKSVRDASDC